MSIVPHSKNYGCNATQVFKYLSNLAWENIPTDGDNCFDLFGISSARPRQILNSQRHWSTPLGHAPACSLQLNRVVASSLRSQTAKPSFHLVQILLEWDIFLLFSIIRHESHYTLLGLLVNPMLTQPMLFKPHIKDTQRLKSFYPSATQVLWADCVKWHNMWKPVLCILQEWWTHRLWLLWFHRHDPSVLKRYPKSRRWLNVNNL